jgi:hypothetical protein
LSYPTLFTQQFRDKTICPDDGEQIQQLRGLADSAQWKKRPPWEFLSLWQPAQICQAREVIICAGGPLRLHIFS